MSKKKVLLRGVFINRDTNGEGVLKVGTTLIRVSTVMGILYIGYISFDIPYQELRIGEIGYVIGEKWHGKGYGTEAVKKMISEYLSKDRLYLIEAKCNIDNKPSLNLLEKVGFIKDGVLRKRRIDKNTGEYRDLVVYSITTNDK